MDHYRPTVGTKISELDTPCLILDLDALDHNFDRMSETFKDTKVKLREHTKNIKSPCRWVVIALYFKMIIGGIAYIASHRLDGCFSARQGQRQYGK